MKNLRGHNTIRLNAETVKTIFADWYRSAVSGGAKDDTITEVVDVSYDVDSNIVVVSLNTTFNVKEPNA